MSGCRCFTPAHRNRSRNYTNYLNIETGVVVLSVRYIGMSKDRCKTRYIFCIIKRLNN